MLFSLMSMTLWIQLSSGWNRPTKNWRDTLQGKPEERDAVIYAAKRELQIGFVFFPRIWVSQLDAVVTLCKKQPRPSIQEFQCRIRSSAPISAAERDNSIRRISRKNSTTLSLSLSWRQVGAIFFLCQCTGHAHKVNWKNDALNRGCRVRV